MSIDIQLNRINKIYHEKDIITGSVIIISDEEFKHEGVSLAIEGAVSMQVHSKGLGIFDNFYSSIKPISILHQPIGLEYPRKFPQGKVQIPFEVPLQCRDNKVLFETYHGYCIMIQYIIKCEIKRSLLNKDISKTTEFFLEYKSGDKAVQKPVRFVLSPGLIKNNKEKLFVPSFRIRGKLNSTICTVNEPFTGELIIETCDAKIQSLELHLFRLETCGSSDQNAKEESEIQAIQFGSGDVCRGIVIPIYLLFPRLMTCPTLITSNFRVEFEIKVIVIFENGLSVSESFPINLTRF